MPPKPWESQNRIQKSLNIAEQIQQAASNDPELQDTQISNNVQNSTNTSNTGLNSALGTSSFGSNYGSSYGGYGGYGGGMYGSGMYGGGMYGGGMYGGGMYGGGMYGGGMMGRYGMMGRQGSQGEQFMKAMEYLDSFGFVVNSLCEIARMVEMNAEGIARFFVSAFKMVVRLKDFNLSAYRFIMKLFQTIYSKIKDIIKLFYRRVIVGETDDDEASAQKNSVLSKYLNIILLIAGIFILMSFMPRILGKKSGINVSNEFDQLWK